MTLAGFIAVLTAFFKFPEQLTKLVNLFNGSTEADREKILLAATKESDSLKQTGRPTW